MRSTSIFLNRRGALLGGIERSNCTAVMEAGADSVAVISDLVPRAGGSPVKIVEEFFSLLTEG